MGVSEIKREDYQKDLGKLETRGPRSWRKRDGKWSTDKGILGERLKKKAGRSVSPVGGALSHDFGGSDGWEFRGLRCFMS